MIISKIEFLFPFVVNVAPKNIYMREKKISGLKLLFCHLEWQKHGFIVDRFRQWIFIANIFIFNELKIGKVFGFL